MEITDEQLEKIVEAVEGAYYLLDEQIVIIGDCLDKMNDVCVRLEQAQCFLTQLAKQGQAGPSLPPQSQQSPQPDPASDQ